MVVLRLPSNVTSANADPCAQTPLSPARPRPARHIHIPIIGVSCLEYVPLPLPVVSLGM